MASTELRHIGFIVDGNRRWARERGLPTLEGHKRGLDKIELVIESIAEQHIPFASFYIFSTENWNRSEEEVSYLMNLFETKFDILVKKAKKHDMKCIFFMAANDKITPHLKDEITNIEQETSHCTSGTLVFCFNYGGQQEIAEAAESLRKANQEITVESLEKRMYHPEVPSCDLIVRSSGEQRISGFMLWRAAYSELLFLDKYWPDMEKGDISAAIEEFHSRSRRFGK